MWSKTVWVSTEENWVIKNFKILNGPKIYLLQQLQGRKCVRTPNKHVFCFLNVRFQRISFGQSRNRLGQHGLTPTQRHPLGSRGSTYIPQPKLGLQFRISCRHTMYKYPKFKTKNLSSGVYFNVETHCLNQKKTHLSRSRETLREHVYQVHRSWYIYQNIHLRNVPTQALNQHHANNIALVSRAMLLA